MRLRRQLVLVSLVMLALPWAGCQSIQQMEAALREGQGHALVASAQAIAARLESEAALVTEFSAADTFLNSQQLYLHPLNAAPVIDGYADEWRALPIQTTHYPTQTEKAAENEKEFSINVWSGIHNEVIYLFVQAKDSSRDYRSPQGQNKGGGDYLHLRSGDDPETWRNYYLRPTGPGYISASYSRDAGYRQEPRIGAQWRESREGYDIELRIPLSVAGPRFDFALFDGSTSKVIGPAQYNAAPPTWVSTQSSLESLLAPYSRNALRISVLNRERWLIAQADALSSTAFDFESEQPAEFGFSQWLYCLALSNRQFPVLDNARRDGRLDNVEVRSALGGEAATAWYQTLGTRNWYQCLAERVGRAAVPLRGNGKIVGSVVVEQSSNAVLGLTNSAFSGLFYNTLLALGLVSLALFAYASLLSFRIRRLSRAADNAIGEDGKIKAQFLDSKAGDEIGDLTRSYGHLLSRLHDYTEYLRSLASKLSHELRTPLAVVRSSLENLEHGALDEDALRYSQRAREGTDRLASILNAMSAASRVEESIRGSQLESFELDTLVAELSAAYGDAYPASTIESVITADDRGYKMRGAPELIVQMLDKLVDNAVDFCPPDGRITLLLHRDKNQFVLSVRNTGPLLPEHMQSQLFDSLVSVRDDADRGTHLGLGLYIVRLITDFHGGKVSARNLDDGSGVEFIVRLPVA